MKYFKSASKYLLPFLLLLVLSGCGTKRQNFEPAYVSGKIGYDGTLASSIADVTRGGATLKNGQIITKDGLLNVKIPEGYTFLSEYSERYIATSRCGDLIIVNKSSRVLYEKKFDFVVASASLREQKLAVVLGNNTVLLLDIETNNILFRKSGDETYAHDSRIAAPYFLTSVLIFPTLDGKLFVVDLKTNTLLRELVVKSEKFFSNIIYLDVLGDRLVAATNERVVSISPESTASLDEDVRDVIILEDRVLVFTKDGRVILTDADLKTLKTRKFNFAIFVGAMQEEAIYIVERGGYVIVTDLSLDSPSVYRLPSKIDSHIFIANHELFYDNKYFKLTKSRTK